MLTLAATDFLSASAGTAGVITFSAFGDTIVTGADSFSLIAQSTLSNTVATIVPTDASPRLLKTLTFVNTSGSSVPNIRLFTNGTAGSNRIISFALPANGSAKFDANGLSVYDASGSLLTFGLNGRGIVSIDLTSTTGLVDTYTITYSDNSTSTYTVTNGDTPTVVVGATTVVNPNVAPSVTDADAGMDVDLRFNLPRAPTVTAGTTTTGVPGTNASVATNIEPDGDVVLNFTIPRGDTGATGQAAFTSTTANFTQPASAATVSVSVLSTNWMSTGQYLFIETGGYYQVSSITNATTVVLTNLGYPENATAGSTITSGSKVSSAGVRGATGANGQSVAVADEGNQLTAAATSINFTGAGVTATNTGSAVTVAINGGNSFASVTGNSGTATADSPGDTIAITGGTGISTTATDTPDGLVINNTDTGSSAVLAHEALADPHPQYTTPAEASAAAPVQSVAAGAGISVNTSTGAVVVTNADRGSTAVTAHEGLADPHPQYTTAAEAAAAAPVQSVNGSTGAVVISAPSFFKGRLAVNTTTNATAATAALVVFTVAIPPGAAADITANVASTTNATTVGSGIGIRLAQGAGASAAAQGAWSAIVGSAPAAGAADFFDGDIITAAAGATSSLSVVNSVGSATAGTPVGAFLSAIVHNPSTNATATASVIIHAETTGTMAAFAGSAFTAIVG